MVKFLASAPPQWNAGTYAVSHALVPALVSAPLQVNCGLLPDVSLGSRGAGCTAVQPAPLDRSTNYKQELSRRNASVQQQRVAQPFLLHCAMHVV